MSGALRTGLHSKVLAGLDDTPKTDETKEERREACRRRREDRLLAKQAVAAAMEVQAKRNAARKQEEDRIQRYEAEAAEMERKTKRFFDVVVTAEDAHSRKLATRTTGAKYFGDFLQRDNEDWLPHGSGELQFDTGEVPYDGEWRSGLRHGKGIATFARGEQWHGTFFQDQANGIGIYKPPPPEDDDDDDVSPDNNVEDDDTEDDDDETDDDAEDPSSSSSSSSSKMPPEIIPPRQAIYHGESRRAFVDELIPGKRIRVYKKGDGTIVGRTPGRKGVYDVHFDETGRCDVVDLGQIPFNILEHEGYFHRIDATTMNDTDNLIKDRRRNTNLTSFYTENLFRPDRIPKADDHVAKLEAAAQKKWLDKVARETAANEAAAAKAKLDSALSTQQAQLHAASEEAIAHQQEIQNAIAAKKAANKHAPRIGAS